MYEVIYKKSKKRVSPKSIGKTPDDARHILENKHGNSDFLTIRKVDGSTYKPKKKVVKKKAYRDSKKNNRKMLNQFDWR